MKEVLVVAGLGLLVLCVFGVMMFSSYTTTNVAAVSPLGDGGGPPEPVSQNKNITLTGDGGGPPEPVDGQPS
jgi:hypothetical protein